MKFYVSMTFEDWPEGGSYATVVDVESYIDAVGACRAEMREFRADEEELADWQGDELPLHPDEDQWYLVDCFPLDDFIQRHAAA